MLLTLQCDHSTHLVSNDFCGHSELSTVERWAVRLHELCCRSCRRFREQVEFMQNASRALAQRELSASDRLPAASRERIRATIERHAE